MRLETVVNALPQGASRTANFSYPPSTIYVQGTTAQQQNLVNRQGTAWQNFFSVTSSGGGGTNTGFTHYRGRPCFRYGDTGAGQADLAFTGTNLKFAFPQVKPVTGFRDDFSCWQVTLVAAFTSGGTESGIEIGPNARLQMILASDPGIGLVVRAANSLSLIACQGAALTIDQQIANTTLNGALYDSADWHVYTLRILGATVSSEAVLKVYADGLLTATKSWGAGTLLPGQAQGVNLGWGVSVGARLGDWYLAIGGLSVSAAATEAGLP
jgi:hypothetical protein